MKLLGLIVGFFMGLFGCDKTDLYVATGAIALYDADRKFQKQAECDAESDAYCEALRVYTEQLNDLNDRMEELDKSGETFPGELKLLQQSADRIWRDAKALVNRESRRF